MGEPINYYCAKFEKSKQVCVVPSNFVWPMLEKGKKLPIYAHAMWNPSYKIFEVPTQNMIVHLLKLSSADMAEGLYYPCCLFAVFGKV